MEVLRSQHFDGKEHYQISETQISPTHEPLSYFRPLTEGNSSTVLSSSLLLKPGATHFRVVLS